MGYEGIATIGRLESIPPHVPAGRVIEFDYFNPPGAEIDPHLAWKKLHDGPDLVFTPYNGGHWIATRADDIFAIMHDPELFSSAQFTVPKRSPENPPVIPLDQDPPAHGLFRSILLRPLAPKAIAPFEPAIRALMQARIARIAPNRRCEFVSEFAFDVPPELFLEHANVPKDQLLPMKAFADELARGESEADRVTARIAGFKYMQQILEQRRGSDGEDVFSAIMRAEADGNITWDQAVSLALNVFFGGLETVSSALAFIVLFLAQHPEHRRQLIADPSLSQDATEEFLRRFGILNLARIATRRTSFKNVSIEEGEQVMLPLHLANLDERKFPDPMKVDFKRKRAAHFNFGSGAHRCVGSNLARPEIRIFIEEWLKQIPDFEVDPADNPIGKSGVAMTMTRVPLVW